HAASVRPEPGSNSPYNTQCVCAGKSIPTKQCPPHKSATGVTKSTGFQKQDTLLSSQETDAYTTRTPRPRDAGLGRDNLRPGSPRDPGTLLSRATPQPYQI